MLVPGKEIDYGQLVALLAIGARVTATRSGPFPFRFIVELGSERAIVAEARVREAVEAQLLVPRPQDLLWDTVAYEPRGDARAEALRHLEHGFGRCASCSCRVVAAIAGGKAARHSKNGGGSCAGSGKRLVDLVASSAQEVVK